MSTPNQQDGPTHIAGEPASREPGKPVPPLTNNQPPNDGLQSSGKRTNKAFAFIQVLLLLSAIGISSYSLYAVASWDNQDEQTSPTSELLVRTEGRDADGLCAQGGSLIMIGADQNLNDYLDGSEITSTTTLCHGEQGPAGYSGSGTTGATSLINTAPILIGNETCLAGGLNIQSGIDANENNVLELDEITTSEALCNGPLGPTGSQGAQGVDGGAGIDGAIGQVGASALVVQTTPLASVCSNGLIIHFGVDDGAGTAQSHDGVLQEDEIRTSLNICSQPLFVGPIADYSSGSTNGITNTCDALLWMPKANLLITAGSNGVHGCELWASDGTAEASSMLLDINPNGDASPGQYTGFVLVEDEGVERVVFDADDGMNGRRLWSTDGTASGTTVITGNTSTEVASMVASTMWNGGVAMLNTPNVVLWTNGTVAINLLDHASLAQGMSVEHRSMYGNLSAFQPALWQANDGWLWFSAKSTTGIEPYALHTDGALIGWDLVTGDANAGPSVAVDDGRIVVANNGQGRQLVRLNHDGSHLWLTALMHSGTGSQATHVAEHLGLHRLGDTVVFDALTSGVDPKLWAHNLTQATTMLLSTTILAPGDLTGGIVHDHRLWFDCVAPGIAQEVCSSDGTPSGTQAETDLRAGSASALIRGFAVTEGDLFVLASGQINGNETGSCLWTLGSNQAPVLLYDPWTGNNNSYAGNYGGLHASEHHVFFAANDGTTGHEWHAFSHGQLSDTWLVWP
jgi:ELWxxDGT repeat protein